MKVVVFSDVHGNLPALKIMLEHAGSVDGYICLGDTVDYGPWSNECVDLVCSLPHIVNLAGNHEQAFLDGHYPGSNPIAKLFFTFCYPSFTQQTKIRNLKQEYLLNNFIFRHTIDEQNIYPDSKLTLEKNYVIGHSHHQFKIEQPPFILCNPGSVGQNRKYINVIDYMLLETDTMQFEPRSIIYDEQLIIQEMRIRQYPKDCIDYYDNKQRFLD